jgi:hypothetical protein
MPDHRPAAPDDVNQARDAIDQRLSRRHLIAGSGAAVAATALGGAALGQEEASPVPPDVATAEASPVGSPVAEVDPTVFRVICQAATGVTDLDDDAVTQLLGLIEADGPSAAGLGAMLAAGGGLDLGAPPEGAEAALANIVEFFYLGQFNGAPVENRADLFPGLVSFQTLPYVTVPAICKAYGYWATEVDLPERA